MIRKFVNVPIFQVSKTQLRQKKIKIDISKSRSYMHKFKILKLFSELFNLETSRKIQLFLFFESWLGFFMVMI